MDLTNGRGPIDKAAWAWESLVWEIGDCLTSPQLDEPEARQLLADLWARHRHPGRALFKRVPQLIVDPDYAGAGLAQSDLHRIIVRASECRLPVLLHEIGHLLTPGAGHGPGWVEIMLQLWEAELHVPRSIALLAGRQLVAA